MNNFTVHVLYLLIDAFGKDQFSEEEFIKFLIENIGIADKRALRSCFGYLKRKNLVTEKDETYKLTQLFYDFSNRELLENDKYVSLLDILMTMALQKKSFSDVEFCDLFGAVEDGGKLQLLKLKDELFSLKLVEFDSRGKVKLSIDGLGFFWSRSSVICVEKIKSPPKKVPRISETPEKNVVDHDFLTALKEPLGKHNLLPFLKDKYGAGAGISAGEKDVTEVDEKKDDDKGNSGNTNNGGENEGNKSDYGGGNKSVELANKQGNEQENKTSES